MTTSDTSLAEILAALPDDLDEGAPASATLAEIVAAAGQRPLPANRFSRFWSLGTLQGKIAAAYAFWWLRTLWQGADERERLRNETHLKAAIQLLGTMSELRGAVMKLGQVLAHWPDAAPEAFADVLGRLHFEAPPMHFSLLRERLRSELGADPEQAFAAFDQRAAAAASLGQVHRARLADGGDVAVKIQYPGIARSITSDMANLRTLLLPMRLGADGDSIRQQLDDVEAMLALEVDYVAEAENLRRARATLSDMPEVVVPAVHAARSTARVLTMDWVPGAHLEEYLAGHPSQAERDRHGATIARSFMRLCYRSHLLYADLHPGNYLFLGDGRLGLIDFGCVRRYTPEEVAYLTTAERAGFLGPEAIREAVIEGADLTDRQRREPERIKAMVAWYEWMCLPTMTTEPFDFGDPAYLRQGMSLWRDLLRRRYVRSLPVNTWIAKSFIGLRAMLHRLGAQVPLGQILREETSVELPHR